MIYPKVVVCCPTYEGKNYCFDRWIEQYYKLTYPNKTLFIVDNSDKKENYKRIGKLGIKNRYINPKGKPVKRILAESHEACRQFALACEADFMLHWEVDVFIDDPEIIQRLMRSKKAVINGMYPIRTGADREMNIMLCDEDTNLLHQHRKVYSIKDNCPEYIDGSVKLCYSCGLGLTLIHKMVLKKIQFRYYTNNEALPDFIFASDLWDLDIYNYVDTSVYCTHDNREWYEEAIPDLKLTSGQE